MKNIYTSILLLFISINLAAQNAEIPVRFTNGNFVTGSNVQKQTFKQIDIQPALVDSNYYLLLQFTSLPGKQQQEQLKASGIQLTEYVPGNAYLAIVKKGTDFQKAASYQIKSINIVPSHLKVDRAIAEASFNDKKEEKYLAVNLFPGMDKRLAELELAKLKATIVKTKYIDAPVIFIQPDKNIVDNISRLPFVSYINLQSIKDKLLNNYNTSTHSITSLQSLAGRNLDGRTVTIGVGDNADITTHVDLSARVINRVFYVPEFHGTHTSGTAAGAGILNPLGKGMAPKAPIVSQWFSDILTNTPSYVADHNMIATNNSYYSSQDFCPGNSKYDVLSNYLDEQARTYSQVLHVIASGNDGSLTCNPYPNSFATVKSGWQTAKNAITVGNMYSVPYTIFYQSSRGPVQDGRIKPEIVTNGTGTYSTTHYNTYSYSTGTSMAAPVVTGTLSLLQQRFRQLNGGNNASSALMKAVMCNGATDLGNAGPDFTYGFGMLNARTAVEALEANRYFTGSVSTGATNPQMINVPAGARRLKVMICWTDKEATPNAAFTLVNDIDLSVTAPSAAIRKPLVLNSSPANVTDLPVERRDSINNIEQVVIENPAAGNYTLNVNGFSVPFGPQDYALTYQIDMPSVIVEYPFGGETFAPNETEIIRWNAFGNEANDYTIEYSPNGGTNWLSKDTVPAGSRSFSWVVPDTAVNNAVIRISRLGTGLSDVSDFPFVILGQPVVTATVPCIGYAQLGWPAITGATSYDIYQLKGDSMKVIGNTTGTSFIVSGLDQYKTEWLAVAAKIGAVPGRRSMGKQVVANTGACSLSTFDNDLVVDTILEPNTARVGFSNAADASKPLKIRIKNLGSVTAVAPFDVSYSVSGGAASAPETINTNIAPGASIDYIFTNSFPVIPAGFRYHIRAWVTKTNDNHHDNDTAYKWIKLLNNDPIALPYSEGFESFTDKEYVASELGLFGNGGYANDKFDFGAGSSRSRLRTFVNTGIAQTGTRAITLDQRPIGAVTSDTLIMSVNGTAFAAAQSRFEFSYKNHGQENFAGNKVWMRASESDPWIMAYDLYLNQASIGQYRRARININDVLSPAVPTATFQIKFGQEGATSTNSVVQEQDYDDGYTFDDIAILEAQNDVALLQVISPTKSGCGLGAATPITISIRNYSPSTVNNVQVNYRINGGSIITENISSIAGLTTIQHTFGPTANLAAYIDYSCDFWLSAADDTYKGNDSVLAYTFHNSPVISSYPYLEGFENNEGNWFTKGNINSWQYGTPAKTVINKAANGTKAWVTSLTGNYKNNELSYLYSPCFDLSTLAQPVLSFSHIFHTEEDYDYNWVDYSTDGGITWQKLTTAAGATNWYDEVGPQRWNESQSKWHVASVNVPPTAGTVRFRFVMFADGGVTYEGVGIDDVHVFDKQAIYTGAPISSGLSQTVNTNGWVHYNDGSGKRVASINSYGQNLGTTEVQVYPYAGPTRTSNNQYYANRNIVVRPAIQPTGNTGVRFYFTDAEAKNLVAASGCTPCIKPNDPYELGVTKYSGGIVDENGNLDDDQPDLFEFILPANTQIIPYDNGYYAEFNVSSFSEFWLSKGILGAGSNCAGGIITYTAASGGSTYQWQEDSGSGFTNITNGANYTGATTNTLQLIGFPTSNTGYKYRALVDGVPDATRTLRFKMTWNGSASTDWMDPANWSCNALPDQYTDVIIPGTLLNYPVLNTNTAVRSVIAQPGVSVTIAAGATLDIKGK